MKLKTTKLFAGLLCLMTLCFGQQAKAQTLVLHHADGTTTDVELYNQPQVLFKNDKVFIVSTVLNMEYSKDNVLRFTYKGSPNRIQSAQTDAEITREGGQLVIHGIQPATAIAVYTANGIRVPVTIQRSSTSATLPLSSIPSGVYLFSVNGRTAKFTKP